MSGLLLESLILSHVRIFGSAKAFKAVQKTQWDTGGGPHNPYAAVGAQA